jgi:hypothetical protein
MILLINDLLFNFIRRPKENIWTCLRWFVLSTVTTSLESSPKEAIAPHWLRHRRNRDAQQLAKLKSLECVDSIEELIRIIPADPSGLANSPRLFSDSTSESAFIRATNSWPTALPAAPCATRKKPDMSS